MNISRWYLLILLFLLPACMATQASEMRIEPTADLVDQAETIVAVALTQTALAAPPTPAPAATSTPAPPPEDKNPAVFQKAYRDAALGIQFDYPAAWFLQAVDSQPNTIGLSSFDPAKPPHKLEWTDQTVSMQFRLLAAENAAPSLEAWVDKAKETAEAGFLSVFSQEALQIAAQPAVHLTLVSGSGGVIHQVLTVLDGKNVEILCEGNFSLGQTVLDSVRVIPSEGVKPADSDTPAAGICGEAQGEIMPIVLGAGPDGLPLAGRCIIFAVEQRILLFNGTDAALVLDFGSYHVDLPAGGELLLDRPVGEYLALGVHFLPHGPEIWVK